MIITLVFEKNANFFAENCQKSPKIVIITSTPGERTLDLLGFSFITSSYFRGATATPLLRITLSSKQRLETLAPKQHLNAFPPKD
jgi:hypothetical protein